MKIIGAVGVLHVLVIIGWMIFHLIFQNVHPVTFTDGKSLAEIGMAYYSNFPGYLGFDHGSKALIMLLSIIIPIGLYFSLQKTKDFRLLNLIGLVSGSLGFALYSLSLMLQAVTVEYAFKLYRSSEQEVIQTFATQLYEWAMLEGGLSVSIYIIANLLLANWMIIHSMGFIRQGKFHAFARFGIFVGVLQTIGYLIAWFFLMQGEQNLHNLNEAVGLLFTVWILILSLKLWNKQMNIRLKV